MVHFCDVLSAKARRDPRWFRPACWASQVRSLILYARLVPCETLIADHYPAPTAQPTLWQQPFPKTVRDLSGRFASALRARIEEARMTLALEAGVVGMDVLTTVVCVVEGSAYTKGWEVFGNLSISQPLYGWVLGTQAFLRLMAVVAGSRSGRLFTAATSFVIHATVLWAMHESDPGAKARTGLFMVCASDAWAFFNLRRAQYERRP